MTPATAREGTAPRPFHADMVGIGHLTSTDARRAVGTSMRSAGPGDVPAHEGRGGEHDDHREVAQHGGQGQALGAGERRALGAAPR